MPTNKSLIARAAKIVHPVQTSDHNSGDVGCALVSEKGKIFTGICLDVTSGMGFCAEHNAIGSMATTGEYRIKKIVAVWKDEKGKIIVIPPCGRCREFMYRVDRRNLDTEVILGEKEVVKLRDLLPRVW